MSLKLEILTSFLGDCVREGDEYLFRCPFCPVGKAKRKLSVNLHKNVFRCWICGPKHIKNKKIINLARINHDAFEKWIKLTGASEAIDQFEVFKNKILNKEVDVSDNLQFPEDFEILLPHYFDEHNKYVNYLKKRGMSFGDFLYWKPGISHQRKFQDRVIFPSFDEKGEYNYYISRSINDYDKDKYRNSWVNKFSIIFNEHNISWKRPIHLVEGLFDAANIRKNTAILLGTELNESSKLYEKLIVHEHPIYVMLDLDAKEKAEIIIQKLVKHNRKVYYVDIGEYKDPGEIPQDRIQPIIDEHSTFYNSKYEYIKAKYQSL